MDVNSTETIFRLIALIEKGIEAEKTITIKADDITIKSDGTVINGLEVTME